MIRIDLRYIAPIVAFYIPPVMFMTLGWMVGYSIADMRKTLVLFGGMFGSVSAICVVLFYSREAKRPQWFYIRGKEKE